MCKEEETTSAALSVLPVCVYRVTVVRQSFAGKS